jgi:hypothetical protein
MIANLRLSVCKIHHFFSLIKYVGLIFLFLPVGIYGQYRFDFEIDSAGTGSCCQFSEWEQLPENRWCCDSMEAIEGGSSLHHCYDNISEGCDFLLFRHDPFSLTDSFSVSFRIRHAYAPSSQNNWQVALAADIDKWQIDTGDDANGEGSHIVNGIVMGVNFTGSDDLVKVWSVNKGEVLELCSTPLNFQEQVGTDQAPLFILQGDGGGRFSLYWSPDQGTQGPELLGSCSLDWIPRGRHLILRYRYSAARDMGLWMDRLIMEGHFERDTLAPSVNRVKMVDKQRVQVDFSESVIEPGPDAFSLISGAGPEGVIPDSVRLQGGGYILTFPEDIPNRIPQQLQVKDIQDPDGNILHDTLIALMRNDAQWGDLVFSEVMADPDPAVRYSEEYLELYNRSDYELNLKGWLLKVNERSYLLDPCQLFPGDYFLLSGITLPNEGALLSLYDSTGLLVHAVAYRKPWDGPEWKKEGGWSLESPDPDCLCMVSSAWEFSTDPGGGTPGSVNSNRSQLADLEPPVLLYAGIEEPGRCRLHFSEPIRFPEGSYPPVLLDPGGVEPESVKLLDPLSDILELSFTEDFSKWTGFMLSLSGWTDCTGNPIDAQEIRAGKISPPVYGSVLINEIMFDPEEDCPAYVELYLPGDRFYDLQDLSIHLVEEGGSPDSPLALASHSRLVLPGQYLVVTECIQQLEEVYRLPISGCWVEVDGMSRMKRSSGTIYLTDRAGNMIDMATYNEQMHMELLDDPRGISLERISPERSGIDPDNWHSAASVEGYSTPGRENSQSVLCGDQEDMVKVQPEVFSPDNDGYNDLLNIMITTGSQDWVIGLLITDLLGNRVRILANNDLAGPSVTYTWDGRGEDGTMLPVDFYVVHIRGYHPDTGEHWVRRRAVGLVYR